MIEVGQKETSHAKISVLSQSQLDLIPIIVLSTALLGPLRSQPLPHLHPLEKVSRQGAKERTRSLPETGVERLLFVSGDRRSDPPLSPTQSPEHE